MRDVLTHEIRLSLLLQTLYGVSLMYLCFPLFIFFLGYLNWLPGLFFTALTGLALASLMRRIRQFDWRHSYLRPMLTHPTCYRRCLAEPLSANKEVEPAALDRLVHHSVVLELNLPSYRLEASKRQISTAQQAEAVDGWCAKKRET